MFPIDTIEALSGENRYENWVKETCDYLLENDLETFNGWFDFAQSNTVDDVISDALESGITSACKKISQKESQKAAYIIRVLTIIERHGPINVSNIITRSKLSINSVNRTLKLLKEENIVHVKQTRKKINNEKFFTTDKDIARKYIENILLWKGLPEQIVIKKHFKNLILTARRLHKKFTDLDSLYVDSIMIKSKLHKFTPKLKLIDLPVDFVQRILKSIENGFICTSCLEEGIIFALQSIDTHGLHCMRCGKDEYPVFVKPTRGKLYRMNKVERELLKAFLENITKYNDEMKIVKF
jgi:DNA-binding transcriptional ArsR family regulator